VVAWVSLFSFIPPGSDSMGMVISTSSGIGFAAPSAASASAHLFPLLESCPFTHLNRVRADQHLIAYAAAFIQGAFGTLGHPESSHLGSALVRQLMTYRESVIIVRSAFRGADFSATTTAANSPTWLDWVWPGTCIALFKGWLSVNHTPPLLVLSVPF